MKMQRGSWECRLTLVKNWLGPVRWCRAWTGTGDVRLEGTTYKRVERNWRHHINHSAFILNTMCASSVSGSMATLGIQSCSHKPRETLVCNICSYSNLNYAWNTRSWPLKCAYWNANEGSICREKTCLQGATETQQGSYTSLCKTPNFKFKWFTMKCRLAALWWICYFR